MGPLARTWRDRVVFSEKSVGRLGLIHRGLQLLYEDGAGLEPENGFAEEQQ